MEVLAWSAGVENEARAERIAMGMAKRLSEGKVNLPHPIYGYNFDMPSGALLVKEIEAHWVQQIWLWYAEGVSRKEIRMRLIAADAPQTDCKAPIRKHKWSLAVIDNILKRDAYHTGIYISKYGGHTYQASIPVLIDGEIFAAAQERHKQCESISSRER